RSSGSRGRSWDPRRHRLSVRVVEQLWCTEGAQLWVGRRWRVEVLVDDAEVTEPPGGDEHAGLERRDRLVVGAGGRVQGATQARQVAGERRDPTVQLLAQGEHLLGVRGK